MQRTHLFAAMLAGSILYHAAKLALGLAVDWREIFDAAYWSGAALLMHWYFAKQPTEQEQH